MRAKIGRPAATIDLRRASLLLTASLTAVVAGLSAAPANAQLARLRGGEVALPQAGAPRAAVGDRRSASMREALARQKIAQDRAAEMRSYVTAARQAAVVTARAQPTDGLSERGLNPIAEVREAIRLSQAGSADDRARADAIVAGLGAALDPTGTRTWDGAGLPTQTVAGGQTTVTITQTQPRAVLSWNRFDVGASTTVEFNQKLAGAPQPSWTAVNRVVDASDPTTILGKIKADGSVYILNPRGVIFGKGAQVNLHSLLASSLDLGNLGRDFGRSDDVPVFSATTIRDRNLAFLDNGPFAVGATSFTNIPPLLLSPVLAEAEYRVDRPLPTPELGAVVVDPGATVTAQAGGSIILAGPRVENAGVLSATDGQVSLQGGHLITFAQSTGAATSVDPDVRGVILRTVTDSRFPDPEPAAPRPQDGIVVNTGLIESRRGYLSLGAGVYGEVLNQGLLTATTSVTRNGKIAINAGTVTIGGAATASQAGGIVITPDDNGETIPQGTAVEPPNFKTSKIEIGARGTDNETPLDRLGRLQPADIVFSDNSLLFAPGADVTIGAPVEPGETLEGRARSGVTIGANAIIDVGGIKDVEVDVARNIIEITPVKRNELRDTPNYREVAVDDTFTLNGTTLFVDVRRSGVRADGVRWVGSPLIEAGSLASQIQITAAELMTEGGTLVIANASPAFAANATAANATVFSVAKGAVIDFSSGWIRYTDAQVPTSQLVTADGRVVDIAAADPNDSFVAVRNGFTEEQPRFGVRRQFDGPISVGTRFEAGYDEGSDAGSLRISTVVSSIDGALFGNAYAGERQRAGAAAPTLANSLAGDPRRLQRSADELPAGGYLSIGPVSEDLPLGGDIVIYKGSRGAEAALPNETLLDDAMLSAAGLSALALRTSGSIIFADAGQALLQPEGAYALTGRSSLSLAPGGRLELTAGRSIRFDGDIEIAGGVIVAETLTFATAPPGRAVSLIDEVGSIFRTDDDIRSLYASAADAPTPFDIVVNGRLSAAGRWTNDSTGSGFFEGGGWIDGGSITLTTAPRIFAALGDSVAAATDAVDLSGSILVNAGATLDVSAGGYVSSSGTLDLSGRGGDVALVNSTVFAAIQLTQRVDFSGDSGASDTPLSGTTQTIDFTPLPAEGEAAAVLPQLVPSAPRSRVAIDGNIEGFGFEGGGTFRLVSPDVAFGSGDAASAATAIPFDFLARTGFGTLDLTSSRSQILFDIFTNDRAGYSAFLETTTFRVRAGETLDLSQTLYSAFPAAAEAQRLLALETGGDIASVLTPAKPMIAFDQRPAALVLGGLSELVVDAGGSITGAADAAIVTPKLVNLGSIVLPGGSITQRVANAAEVALQRPVLAVRDLAEVFGPRDAAGQFDENFVGAERITTREFVSSEGDDRIIVLSGVGDFGAGIELAAGSVTDLSGVALFDPRSTFFGTEQLRTGRLVAGGSIGTSVVASQAGGTATRRFVAAPGARLDLDGASASFDEVIGGGSVTSVSRWSNAGTLRIVGGGSIAGANISAAGGAPQAFGGTLNISNIAILGIGGDAGASDFIRDAQIEAAGFDSLVVSGGLRFVGDVDLDLGRSLIVTSVTTPDGRPADTGSSDIIVSASAGSDVTIGARYIRFQSLLDRADAARAGTGMGDAEVSFVAGALGFDMVGAALFDASIGTTRFASTGDFRLTGIDQSQALNATTLPPVLNGELISSHDLVFDVGRIYATTGTGNWQSFLENQYRPAASLPTNARPFLIAALGSSSISIEGSNINTDVPLSAGGFLQFAASTISSEGHIAAPVGRIDLGTSTPFSVLRGSVAATENLTLAAGSITSVHGGSASIPYGTTVDLAEYRFDPLRTTSLSTLPSGELRLEGGAVTVADGATVDLRGGSNVFAFEFLSGVGGSRDLLDRFNRDQFSGNAFDPALQTGYQYADRRQVFAIVPANAGAQIAAYDPIYAADYGAGGPVDLYGADAGLSVTIDGAGDLAAGEYLLLPAHYALLPGAYRVVENVGAAALAPGDSQTLLDGTLVVGGNYSYSGGDYADATRRSFSVQSAETFLQYSQIVTTSGNDYIVRLSNDAERTRPRLPIDAARVVLEPLTSLRLSGLFDTRSVAGGRGTSADIAGINIVIGPEGTPTPEGTILLATETLARLNAESLMIGATRSDTAIGTTDLTIRANSIRVAGATVLELPEIILAVGGTRPDGSPVAPLISIADGAVLRATGTLSDPRAGDYIIESEGFPTGFVGDQSGVGAVFRLANGPERLVSRLGDVAERLTRRSALLDIGAATIDGETLTLDTSRNITASSRAVFEIDKIAISSDLVRMGVDRFDRSFLDTLAGIEQVTIRSPEAINFDAIDYAFRNVIIDAPGITLTDLAILDPAASRMLSIEADTFTWRNSFADLGGCVRVGARACGGGASDFSVTADEVIFAGGQLRTYGFGDTVSFAATSGVYVEGTGGLATGDAALRFETPVIADRAAAADPRAAAARADYTFLTRGPVTIDAGSAAVPAVPAGNRAPGARIAFGDNDAAVGSIDIDGTLITASAGVIDLRARGDIALSAGATLAAPGYTRTFGDALDQVTVSASGGIVSLVSLAGDISLPSSARLVADDGIGNAGTISMIAANGAIDWQAALNPGVAGARGGSLTFDAAGSAFDLGAFVSAYGTRFGGDIAVRSGVGDLSLGAGQALKAETIRLVADGGAIDIAGTLDTSGANVAGLTLAAAKDVDVHGGDITLFGQAGVTLASTARLDTHTTGYADLDTRVASAGDVTIGIGTVPGAAIRLVGGARIDAGARRTQAAEAAGETGNRLIGEIVKDPDTLADTTVYRFAEADEGGTVHFRAPLTGAAMNEVNLVTPATAIVGASEIELEAYRRFDLNEIAASGFFSGVNDLRGTIELELVSGSTDVSVIEEGAAPNFLAYDFVAEDGTPTLVNFVRNFAVTATGSDLAGVTARPGIELVSRDNILLATNWNLAAAVVDEERAFADGLLDIVDPLGGRIDWLAGTRTDVPFYAVRPGMEGALLDQAQFLYRTGGSARGEAPVLNIRAGGGFTAEGSINDGFFVFRDKSDPQYIDYQLGSGVREYDIAVNFTCGAIAAPSCSPITGAEGTVASFTDTAPGSVASANAVNISLLVGQQGEQATPQFVNSPFSNAANNAAAEGTMIAFENGGSYSVFAGASLEFAELFPVLPGGQTMVSSDLGIVAGASAVALPDGVASWSADPLHVDRASSADVVISDVHSSIGLTAPTSYQVQTLGAAAVYSDNGELQLRFGRLNTDTTPPSPLTYDVADFFAEVADSFDPFGIAEVSSDAYTILTFGAATTGIGPVAREAALAFFGERDRTFTGPAVRRSGVIAPLAEVVAFLEAFAPTYTAGVLDGSFAAALPRATNGFNYAQRRAYVQTLVRTGNGEINIAAASDLDLRGSADVFHRRENGLVPVRPDGVPLGPSPDNAKLGGSAIYTAGVRVAPVPVSARIVGGESVTVSLDSSLYGSAAERVDFVPSPVAASDNSGAIAQGGGDLVVSVGGDVVGRRDVYAERFGNSVQQRAGANSTPGSVGNTGSSDQRWRTTRVGEDTEIAMVPQYFTSGIGALAGGDVFIGAGGRIEELTLALDSTMTTAAGSTRALLTFGHGNLKVSARGDIAAGQFDVAHGAARIDTAGSVVALGSEPFRLGSAPTDQYLRVRLTDATVAVGAKGAIEVASVTAIDGSGAQASAINAANGAGNLSMLSSFSATAPGDVRINNSTPRTAVLTSTAASPTPTANLFVLPSSLGLVSLRGDVGVASFAADANLQIRNVLYPSAVGQLELLSAGDIRNLSIAMLDHDRSVLPGVFSVYSAGIGGDGRFFEFPGVTPSTSEPDRRLQHNTRLTHTGDAQRALVIAGGTIDNASINLPKQASIIAGGDLTDVYFVGQNLGAGDITRVVAGRDIRATLRTVFDPNAFTDREFPATSGVLVGGPGTLSVEAGRNLGPFAISAVVASGTYGGGIRTVGNELNPWLGAEGADIQVQFGVANGIDYDGLADIYLNPANAANLDGDLFVQVEDVNGNLRPDRSKPVYAPILAEWLRAADPAAFMSIFGGTTFLAGEAALAAAAYPQFGALYDAFNALGAPLQRSFLVNELYFNELKQPSLPTSPSFLQYIRGYRAIEALFPARLGYTDNLAAYETDPSTVNEDHPLGVPRRRIVDGELQQVERVETGSADLRLSTIQTARGGDITILAPGGDLIAGSVLRTSEQARSRATPFGNVAIENGFLIQPFDDGVRSGQTLGQILSIPLGFEGILTLRGGAVRSFSDGDLRLNQSRLFTMAGGDITAWSSNGDLNAGQGPKSASSFAPLGVRFDLNGFPEVDRTASISGGGIGAFKQTPEQPNSSVILIAPVGEVDAGDAGVRASGDIFVAAARVANSENFAAGGDIVGVPMAAAAAAPPVPASAASAIVAQVARLADDSAANRDPRSFIIVDVLGFAGGDVCKDPNNTDPNCPR